MLRIAHAPVTTASPHDTAYALLEKTYRAETGSPMPAIGRQLRGKPYFLTGKYHFSITHTKHHAFCVLSDAPVGIDAEELSRRVDLRLSTKILSDAEYSRYIAKPDHNEALLRFWVLKEAAAKCSGQGLRGYPNHTDFSPDDPRIQILEGCLVAVIQEGPHAF